MPKLERLLSVRQRGYQFRGWVLALVLFLLALTVRLPALDTFITFDEPVWLLRSSWFVTGLLSSEEECPPDRNGRSYDGRGLVCTFQPSYPGVTTMWGGGLGLLFHYLRQGGMPEPGWLSFLQTSRTFTSDTGLIASVRLPGVILNAVFVAIFYILVRRLLSKRVATVAALLVALHPFHAALSRVLHTDALLTTFMIVSLLSILGYWLRGWNWYWLLISAISAGLAFLIKPVSWFLIPNLVMLGMFSLVYYQQTGRWRGWQQIRQLAGDYLAWGLAAGAIGLALFPALWVIPLEVITTSWVSVTGLASTGHPHYFLGAETQDPGLLFYPVGWLLRSSPLEMIGLIVLGGTVLYAAWKQPLAYLRQQIAQRPVEVALLLFVMAFVGFVTVSPKKMVRYLLPAFPVIDIFVAYGLIWLGRRLASVDSGFLRPRRDTLLYGLVIVIQGWLLVMAYPYYFTYFNPLLGGAPTAARMMDISWGEGMDQAAAYLNQLPDADQLTVTVCRGDSLFEPFFVGERILPCAKAEQIMTSDYVVYYLWNRMVNRDAYYWPYFRDHQRPEYRATLAGVDYALVYRNPAQHRTSQIDNRLEDLLTVYGYDLESDGTLRLYWHNAGLEDQQLMVGLASPAGSETHWVVCNPAPGFETETLAPDTLVESLCSLATVDAPVSLYDLQLAVRDASGMRPIESSSVAFVAVGPNRIELAQPEDVLQKIAAQGLPDGSTPLDVTYGDRMRLVGYKLKPLAQQDNLSSEITLFWQPIRRPDAGLARAFQLKIQLPGHNESNEPPAFVTHPIFSQPIIPAETTPGSIVPITYTLPQSVTPDNVALLELCLTIANTGQIVPAMQGDSGEHLDCVPLSSPKETGNF